VRCADDDLEMVPQALRGIVWLQLIALVGIAGFAVHTVVDEGADIAWFFDYPVYYTVVALAVVLCASRALLVRDHRLGWGVMALALAFYAAGEFLYLILYTGEAEPPYPSVADAVWLAFYPLSYLALVLLFRSRFTGLTAGLWIDGIVAALAAATLGSAVVVEAILDITEGSWAVAATNVAYPLGDVVLLSLVIAVFALTAWRPGRTWWYLGVALAVFAGGDSVYLYRTSTDAYVEGGLLDLAWPGGLLLIAIAAWHDPAGKPLIDVRGRALLAVPTVCAGIAAGVLVLDHFRRINLFAITLSVLVLVGVLVRLGVVFRENRRLLALTKREAVTDALTGLGNRRRLMTDLHRVVDAATPERPWLLVMYDLDGFKGYNDSFGHPAGDSLLSRLGEKLATVSPAKGEAYRLGGDEFCLLTPADDGVVERIVEESLAALTERGEGFDVTASFGAAVLPDDATDPAEALRVADGRLYAQKNSRRTQRDRPHQLLLAALQAREPGLFAHLEDVAALALEIGRRQGLPGVELEELHRAAQLHDLGKIAIPDQILHKPGPLDEAEWRFVRQHTLVGERILGASPALRPIGLIVRATHERWDGSGYPDGLRGEEIPLAARIIFACDAFAAMTGERAYRETKTQEEALEELRACAGTQFDPVVVEALTECVRARASAAAA
jgi:diguanylate cyclase (GGDEF)-like protein